MGITLVLVFLLLAIAAFALISGLDKRGERARLMRERLAAIDRAAERNPSQELALLRDELLSSVPAINKLLSKSEIAPRIQKWLAQAAVRSRAGKFILVCACFGGALGLLCSRLIHSSFFLLLGMAFGVAIPVLHVAIKRYRRFSAFEAQLPETIELFSRAVRAGHSFNACLELVSTEMAEPISVEFRQVFEEQKFGLPLRDALLNLTERVPILDVKIFVTAILLQRESGGNLAEILDKLSYVIRERFKILRQVKVYTAQGRLTMAILMVLPFLSFAAMNVISHDVARVLYTDPLGQKLIMFGIVMLTIGFFLIRKIIHIRV